MKEKLVEVYMALQKLDITPTKTNLEILLGALNALSEVYDAIEKREKENDWEKIDTV